MSELISSVGVTCACILGGEYSQDLRVGRECGVRE